MSFLDFFKNEKNTKKESPKILKISLPEKSETSKAIIDLKPTNIKNLINSGTNIDIQNTIDTLLKVDSHFLGKYQDRLSVVNKAQLNWKPASDSQKDIEICDTTRQLLEPSLTNSILKNMLNAIFRRFSVTEIIWELNNGLYSAKLKPLPLRAFEFRNSIYDDKKYQNPLMIYDSENDKARKIPKFKTIITKSDLLFDSEITSISEIIAILIIIKYYALQKDWTRFNELFGLPLRLGTYEENATQNDIDHLFKALESLGSSASGVIGGLTKIDFVQPKNNDPKMFKEIIDLCNQEISKAILGQSGTSESGKESSYASMKILNGVREDIAQESLNLLSEAINSQLIKPFCLYNFNKTEDLPTLSLQLPTDYSKLIERDKGLKSLGIKFKKNYFQKRYNLNEEDFEVPESEKKQIPLSNDLKKKLQFLRDHSSDPFF